MRQYLWRTKHIPATKFIGLKGLVYLFPDIVKKNTILLVSLNNNFLLFSNMVGFGIKSSVTKENISNDPWPTQRSFKATEVKN